jgi:ketopantoate reductase
VATKSVADVSPSVSEIVAPAITPAITVVVLVQNGLNIERAVQTAFPTNIVLSGISFIGAKELTHGHILHQDPDCLFVGPFAHPTIPEENGVKAAKRFVDMYSAGGKAVCEFDETVHWRRWRKLMYNGSYNPVCAITQMDTSRLRLAKTPIEDLVKPLIHEIMAIAAAYGYELPKEAVEGIINAEPIDGFFEPSMQQDIAKVSRNHC